jgi:hypothetical protein
LDERTDGENPLTKFSDRKKDAKTTGEKFTNKMDERTDGENPLTKFSDRKKDAKRLARSLLIKWTDKEKAFEKVFFFSKMRK